MPNPNTEGQILTTTQTQPPYIVVLYNDDYHTFDEVIVQLQKATGCSLEVAETIAFEVHESGQSIAYTGDYEECEKVANILEEIELLVDVQEAT